ncbi:glucose-6-phosphate 1-dehydrogenase [Aureimonas endophytica]|uniref:Glucose-6-phosphate 1-dehydrogenase n=1 Tax=Aureimonas endophytica TaxID=2027858 RepID=A0A917E1M1_9HYPH|nr:glucose-6-phosphate dehydrogenase [Aureimonas endophytica]GGD92871.1 glucose-6-phosphate 1-dehydrogenase [Aureimonas endophytica]
MYAVSEDGAAPPATLVIFGATGDLTRRLLVPALANLVRDRLVRDDRFAILGISFEEGDDETLRAHLAEFCTDCGDAFERLKPHIHYLKGDFLDGATYEAVGAKLEEIGFGNAGFYLAVAPNFFGEIAERLAAAGLLEEREDAFRRLLVEKPFGHDLASARALNVRLLAVLDETQIYRIDHFLGKETVQNIMTTRFANNLLEAVWNHRYVDHVQITAAEIVGVEKRGKYYDATGAMRDMVPNHLFQLLAAIGMEPPNSFDAEAVRTEKAKVVEAIRRVKAEEVDKVSARGRYDAGRIGETEVAAYRDEPNVAPDGSTETYVAMKLFVDNWRWAGVPFYLRTGKRLTARDTEIVVAFKPAPYAMFQETDAVRLPPNTMTMQIQPNEGVSMQLSAKKPGPRIAIVPVDLDFSYADHFKVGRSTGYETLLYDMLIGDQTLFQRADMIESGWAAVQPFLDHWASGGGVETYPAGSAGPAGADRLIRDDGREWHAIG